MNAIDKYNQAKQEFQQFERWAGLINKEYFGGTRGKGGEYGRVISANGTLTIYHQEYDGATNYHDIPNEYKSVLSVAMQNKSAILIEEMRRILQKNLTEAKEEAKKLAEEIIN